MRKDDQISSAIAGSRWGIVNVEPWLCSKDTVVARYNGSPDLREKHCYQIYRYIKYGGYAMDALLYYVINYHNSC